MKHFTHLPLYILHLAFCILFLSSCEKPLTTEEEETSESRGNVTVSIFQLGQTPFTEMSRTASADACTRLNFAVYQDGTRVKQVNQMFGDATFGTASFQLDEGTYQLVAVAHSCTKNPTMTNPQKIQFTNAGGFTDTFLYQQQLTITDQSQHLSLSLDRVASMCRFVITDAIPAKVKKLHFYYTGGSGTLDANTGLGCVNSKQSVFFDVSSGQKQFDLYTFLHDTTGVIHLTVTAHDADDNVMIEHEFDVPMTRRQITWLSGPFFSGSAAEPLVTDITINTEWEGESYFTF